MRVTVVSLAILVVSCGPAAPNFLNDSSVIFAGDKARELTSCGSGIGPLQVQGTWTPTTADVAIMEPRLARLLDAELAVDAVTNAEERTARTEEYYRQYGGLVLQGGRRWIIVNGFVNTDTDSWRTEAICVYDGGNSLFQVLYDPENKSIWRFAFHPMA